MSSVHVMKSCKDYCWI